MVLPEAVPDQATVADAVPAFPVMDTGVKKNDPTPTRLLVCAPVQENCDTVAPPAELSKSDTHTKAVAPLAAVDRVLFTVAMADTAVPPGTDISTPMIRSPDTGVIELLTGVCVDVLKFPVGADLTVLGPFHSHTASSPLAWLTV